MFLVALAASVNEGYSRPGFIAFPDASSGCLDICLLGDHAEHDAKCVNPLPKHWNLGLHPVRKRDFCHNPFPVAFAQDSSDSPQGMGLYCDSASETAALIHSMGWGICWLVITIDFPSNETSATVDFAMGRQRWK